MLSRAAEMAARGEPTYGGESLRLEVDDDVPITAAGINPEERRVLPLKDPDVTVVKVFTSQNKPIQVHLSRAAPWPRGIRPGYYWYGHRHNNQKRQPRWVDQLVPEGPEDAEPPKEPRYELRSRRGLLSADAARDVLP